jgi:hypothetical protein
MSTRRSITNITIDLFVGAIGLFALFALIQVLQAASQSVKSAAPGAGSSLVDKLFANLFGSSSNSTNEINYGGGSGTDELSQVLLSPNIVQTPYGAAPDELTQAQVQQVYQTTGASPLSNVVDQSNPTDAVLGTVGVSAMPIPMLPF